MESKKVSSRKTSTAVEALPGILRTTLAYNKETMLCYFQLKAGSAIPQHNHVAVQIGYVISGKLKFQREDGSSFIADSGTGYVFESEEQHRAEALEDSEVIECFAPMRPEYAD